MRTVIGNVKLKYDTDGDLQIGIFQPMINVTKDEIKNSPLGKCSNKTLEQVRECAQLLLAKFFNKINDIELRDVEKTSIETNVTNGEKYKNGLLKEVEIEFVYVD